LAEFEAGCGMERLCWGDRSILEEMRQRFIRQVSRAPRPNESIARNSWKTYKLVD